MEIDFHNEHYESMLVEPLELMQAVLTPEEYKGFLKGNAIKYAMRAGHKGTEEDAEADADKFLFYSQALRDLDRKHNGILGEEWL